MSEIVNDEFGDVSVFSEERFSTLKSKTNEKYVLMCEIIKKSETALAGFTEWAKACEKNEKAFYTASKEYVELLKSLESEATKPKF